MPETFWRAGIWDQDTREGSSCVVLYFTVDSTSDRFDGASQCSAVRDQCESSKAGGIDEVEMLRATPFDSVTCMSDVECATCKVSPWFESKVDPSTCEENDVR